MADNSYSGEKVVTPQDIGTEQNLGYDIPCHETCSFKVFVLVKFEGMTSVIMLFFPSTSSRTSSTSRTRSQHGR